MQFDTVLQVITGITHAGALQPDAACSHAALERASQRQNAANNRFENAECKQPDSSSGGRAIATCRSTFCVDVVVIVTIVDVLCARILCQHRYRHRVRRNDHCSAQGMAESEWCSPQCHRDAPEKGLFRAARAAARVRAARAINACTACWQRVIATTTAVSFDTDRQCLFGRSIPRLGITVTRCRRHRLHARTRDVNCNCDTARSSGRLFAPLPACSTFSVFIIISNIFVSCCSINLQSAASTSHLQRRPVCSERICRSHCNSAAAGTDDPGSKPDASGDQDTGCRHDVCR